MGNAFSDTEFEDSTKGDDWSKSGTGFTFTRDGVNSSEEESAYNLATFDDDEYGRNFGVGEDNGYTHGPGRQASPIRKSNRTDDTGEQAGWERTERVLFGGQEYEYDRENPSEKKKSPISPILAQIRSDLPQVDHKRDRIIQNGSSSSSYDDDDYESWYDEYKDRYNTGLSPISLASRFFTTINGTDEDDEGIETRLNPRRRSPRRNKQSRKVLSPSNRNAASPSRNLSPASKIWTTVDGDEDDEGIETTLKTRKRSPRRSTANVDISENDLSGSSNNLAETKDPPERGQLTGNKSPKSPRADNVPDKAMKDLIETFARELVKNIAREGTPSNFNIFEEINKRVAQSTQSATAADQKPTLPSREIQQRLDEMFPNKVSRETTNVVSPKMERLKERDNVPDQNLQAKNMAISPLGKNSNKPFTSMVAAPKTLSLDGSRLEGWSTPGARRIAQASPVTKPTLVVQTTKPSTQAHPVTIPEVQTSEASVETSVQVLFANENHINEDGEEEDELLISPAASALDVVRAASPLVTLTSQDFEDVDMKFVQQYDETFEAFVEAHPTLSQEKVDMIMYLRVAKLQKLLEVVDDLEVAFQEKLEKLRTQKKVMTSNYQRELLNATKEKAGREIHLRQELRMLQETTQLLEATLNWDLFLKHKSRADNQFDLLQQLWMKTVDPDDPISALPKGILMQEIRDAAGVVKPDMDKMDDKSKEDAAIVKTSTTGASFEEVRKLDLEVSSVPRSKSDDKTEKKEEEETTFESDTNNNVEATSFENDFSDKDVTATKKEMKGVQMDNAFFNAEISLLENKLAYAKSKSHRDMWVDTMFHQLGSGELARFKKKFEQDVGVPV